MAGAWCHETSFLKSWKFLILGFKEFTAPAVESIGMEIAFFICCHQAFPAEIG
ncbi:hypothetical protein ALO_00835 [Acetonema longum DSM 6540]|uniref:Uncharacterized protein n=1 Tax=Acetonema longum DSM 6540 TaxID=1009370 RepID=F7NDR0_9FIRM|nr:hypothetical protein ALO_00835 [Acetonema longum DSM 6540]